MATQVASSEGNTENMVKLPPVQFIEDVDAYMKGKEPDAALAEIQEKYQTFKLLENRLLQSRARMLGKVPHIEKAIDMVDLLLAKETTNEQITVDFELSDHVYTKATINKGTQCVYLWLGANVMVEYSLSEAKALLEQNKRNAKQNIDNHEKDLNFVRDSITTLEVSLARVYNWDVMQRRNKSEGGGK